MEKTLILLLGWLLGLLSPAISNAIKMRREKKIVKRALIAELHEVRYRVVIAGYLVQMRFGTIDLDYLRWLYGVIESYEGDNPKEAIFKAVDLQLQLDAEELAQFVESNRAAEGGALELKKYSAPLLESYVASLWFFETDFLRKLLEVRANLELLNEEVGQARHYAELTFADLSENNHKRVIQNLESNYQSYARRARIMADKIEELR